MPKQKPTPDDGLETTRIPLTYKEILAWADGLVGVPNVETARRLDLNRGTVAIYQKKVREFVDARMDINEYRLPLYLLYPAFLRSVMKNLDEGDVTMTIAVGKGLQFFVDKQQVDNQTRPSPEELAGIIEDALAVKPEGVRPADEGGVEPSGDSQE